MIAFSAVTGAAMSQQERLMAEGEHVDMLSRVMI